MKGYLLEKKRTRRAAAVAVVVIVGLFTSVAFASYVATASTTTTTDATSTDVGAATTDSFYTDTTSTASTETAPADQGTTTSPSFLPTTVTTDSSSNSPDPSLAYYLVKFAPSASETEQEKAIADVGATDLSRIAPLNLHSISVPVGSAQTAHDALLANPIVTRVDSDATREASSLTTDPAIDQQWSLPRIGWDTLYGSPVAGSATVAVLDTGVDASHEDLQGQLVAATSILDNSAGTTDPNGHGTEMAGIVAAATDNGKGIAGVGYAGVKVMPVTVLGADGTGQDSDVISGVVWAVQHNADVILMAFSNPGFSQSLQDAIDYAWAHNVVVVAATGNDGLSTPTFPAGDRGVIGVSNTDSADNLNGSSNYGQDTFLAAPGTGILTTALNNDYTNVTGTSAAAAIVAGSAGLLRARSGTGLSNGVIVNRLAESADAAGTATQTGNGRLSLGRAALDTSTASIEPAGSAPVGGGGPYVGPYVASKQVSGNLEGQANPACSSGGICPWQTNQLTGWAELQTVPLRLHLDANQQNDTPNTFTISIDHASGATAGLESLTNLTPTSNVTMGPITFFISNGGDIWNYQFSVDMTDNNEGFITFNTRLRAGAHAFGGASLQVKGASTLQFVKPAAAPGTPDLTLTKQSLSSVSPGQTFTYTLQYQNVATGSNSATGVQLTDTLPSNATYVANSCTGGCSYDSLTNTLTWNLGTIAAGSALATQTFQVTVNTTTNSVSNTAQIFSAENDATPANNTATKTSSIVTPSISGTVISDPNGDGIDQGDGTGLAGASLSLFLDNAPLGGTKGPEDTQVGSAVTTAASGDWAFTAGLLANKRYWVVRTNPPGYTSTQAIAETVPAATDNSTATKATNDQINVTFTNATGPYSSNNKFLAKVTNNPPTANAGGPYSGNEGSAIQLNGSGSSDPDPGDTLTYAWTAPAGCTLSSATATSPTVTCNDNGTYTVSLTITDNHGASSSASNATVMVANVAPTAALSNNGPINEGSSATISFSGQSDPSSVDTAAGFHYAYACDNSSLAGATYAGSGTSASTSCSFNDNGSFTVRARIIDKDNGFTEDQTTVTVNNVAPTATLSNNGPIDEGSSATISFSGQSDPSSVDTAAGFHYAFACDNSSLAGASYAGSGASASTSCSFNDNGSFIVRGRIIDKDGGFSEYQTTVTVNNVAPTATLANNGPINEGSSATISFSGQSDPSSVDTAAGFHYAYACDNSLLAGATYAGSGTSASTSCSFNDNGSFTVRARIIDKDNGFTEYQTTVTVNNVAPTATLSNNGPVNEGSLVTVSFSGQSDPSSVDTAAGFHYAFACDNSSLAGANYGNSGTTASTGCVFDDGPSTHTVRARIIDKDNGFTEYATTLTVNNVAPTASLGNNGPVNEGSPATISFSNQLDPSSADTVAGFHYAYSCSNGDLSGANYAGSGTNASTSCTFADNGVYTVKGRIIDKDGGFSEYTTNVTVNSVNPTATLSNNGPINEGSSATISFSGQSDPSSADTAAGFHYAYSCTNGDLSSATYLNTTGSSASTSCSFNDNGSFTVRARILDKDDGFTEYTTVVTVNNVNPAATLSNNGPINEGSSATISFSNQLDPSSADTTAGFHYAYSCTNGSLAGATYAGSGTNASTSCAFDDNGSFTVRARIIDKDGGFSEYQTTVTVNNVAPTATLSNNGPIDEGSSATISFSGQSDPSSVDTAAGFHYAYACDNGSLAGATYAGSGTATSTSCAFNDNGSFTVRARIIDKDGGFSEYQTTVSVTNVAPTATLSNNGPVNEGSPVTVSFSGQFDPSSADTSAGFHYAYACDNGSLTGANYGNSGTADSTICTFDDGPSSHTVRARIIDKDGGFSEYQTTVSVTNVAPTATLANNGPINEGSSATISFSSQFDTSSADTAAGFHYAYACDNGSLAGATYAGSGTSASTSCTFDDGPSTHIVRARIIDKDGGFSEYQTTVTVNNVAPTASFANNGPVNEGSLVTVTFSSPLDPSSADTAAGFHYAFACDNSSLAGATYAGSGTSASTGCVFDDGPSTHIVGARIIDKDGGFTEYTTSVQVNNVAPTATLSNNGPVNEGSPATVSFSNQLDPSSADTVAGFHYAYSCSNGDLSGATYAGSGTSASTTCTFADNGVYTAKGRIIDKDGGYTEYTTLVTVNNVAPTATLSNNGPINEGSSATISFSNQLDPSSADTSAGFHYAYSCSNGDLSSATYLNTAGSSASTSCPFNDNGSYTVKARIIDKDDGFTQYTTTVTVNNVAPTATLSNDGPINEGSSVTVSFSGQFDPSSVDTAAGFHYAYSCTNGDLSGATYGGSGSSASTTCPFDDGPSDPVVKARIIDKDGGYSEYTTTVHVNNVAPIATFTNTGPVKEGSSFQLSLSAPFDPSNADTAAGFQYAFDCGDGSGYGAYGPSNSATCPTNDNGVRSVKGKIKDKDDGVSYYTASVTVNNVAPTATLSNNGPVNEGSPATISFSAQFDPSSVDTAAGFHYAYACDNSSLAGATYGNSGTGASTTCTFDDGPSDHTVRARIIDKDGGYSEYTTSVHVNNVAPTASLSNNGPVNEGSPATISFSGQFDPSTADTAAGFHYAYSCSNGDLSGATFAGSGASATTNCTFNDNGGYTVKARIIDKDGGFTEYTTAVTVNNVAPTATLSNNGPINEGSSVTVSFSGQFDPSSADTAAGFHYAYSCTNGDLSAATYAGSGSSPSMTCSFDDGPSDPVVKARIIDKDGGFTEYTTTVHVNNVAPTAIFGNTGPVNEGSSFQLSLSGATDLSNADTSAGFQYAFDCGDGSGYGPYSSNNSATCPTNDNGVRSVKGKIKDKDNGVSYYTASVTVNNVAPTAALSNNGPVNEGSPVTVSFSAQFDPSSADTSAGFHYAYACDNGSLASATYATAGTSASTTCTFNDNGSYTVRARIIDKDGGFSEYQTTVTVNNVPPTATLSNNGPINEGSSATISLSGQFDPSSADTTAGFHYAYACDNSSLAGATYAGSGTSATKSCTFNDNGSFTVRARIIDKDGGYSESQTTVTVNNVAPTATLSNNGPVNEASAVTVSFSGQSDPSSVDTAAGFHYAYSCTNGDLSGATYAGSGSSATTTCSFDDGPSDPVVKARIIDKDGGFTEYTTTVHVNNVAPTATLLNGGPVNEGSPVTVYFAGASDPSNADTSAGFHYTFDCNGGSLGGSNYGNSGTTASTTCTFPDGPTTQTVSGRIIDKDGGFTDYTTTVTVKNVAPTATLSNNSAISEGSSATVSFSGQSDPSAPDTAAEFHYAYHCDGSTFSTAPTYAGSGASASTSCTFSDNGSYTVRARIIDKDNGYTEYTTTVNVTNVPPTVTAPGNQAVNEGTAKSFALGSFNDPGAEGTNGWTVTVAWGDGSLVTTFQVSATGTIPPQSHTYDDGPATRTVTVTVTDKDLGSDSKTFQVTVYNVNPTATLNGPATGVWGTPYTYSFSGQGDPSSADTAAGFHYAYDCNGGSLASTTYATSGTSTSTTCTYATPGNYTVRARIMDKDNGYTEYTKSVSIGKRATTLVYSGDTAIQFSDVATLKAKLTDNTDSSNIQGRLVTFTIGSQTASATTDANGVAQTTLKITQVAGSYTVASAFDGTADTYYSSSGDSDPFTINKEDAAIEYSGDVFKNTPANTTTSLNLSSVIREAGAAGYSGLPATNESPASLGNQLPGRELVFNLYTFNGTTPYKTCSATITAGATAGTGNATCTVTGVAIDDNPYRVDVSLTANGYYMAPIESEAVVVQTSGTGFVTGGGWLNEPNLGSRSNFGFTVKWLKNGNLQGNSLYIYRKTVGTNEVPYGTGYLPAGQYNWQIKSNSWSGGGLNSACTNVAPIKCTATFSGKANIQAMNRVTGTSYSLGGNYQYQVDIDDYSEPGSSPGAGPDKYAIRVWDPVTGTYYQLGSPRTWNPTYLWDPTYSGYGTRLNLNGGNNQVHT